MGDLAGSDGLGQSVKEAGAIGEEVGGVVVGRAEEIGALGGGEEFGEGRGIGEIDVGDGGAFRAPAVAFGGVADQNGDGQPFD